MKMVAKQHNVIKSWKSVIIFFIFCFVHQVIFSQNYVGRNNEMVIRSAIDFSTSSVWETDKSVNPGFFTWLANSENYEGVSDAFHVNGYVKKVGNTEFTYPVGTGADLRRLSISAPANSNAEYAVAWFLGDPSDTPDPSNGNDLHSTKAVSGTLTAVSPIGQWDWIPVVGDGAGLTITVSIPALSGDFFTNAADIRLIGWNGTVWVPLGTTGASGLTEDSLLSGTMISGIQSIGIGSVGSIVSLNYTVVQNDSGFLEVSGKTDKNCSVLITFPDGTTATVLASDTGNFGPVISVTPQSNSGYVTVVATTSSGLSSGLVQVDYDYPDTVLVSEAFSPNGDGINDTWKIYGLEKFHNSTVRVFNKMGYEIFSSFNYQNDWDGHYKNSSVLSESGSYLYQIDFGSDGSIDKQGWLYLRK